MRPIRGFEHLMSTSVTVAARTSEDRYGKPTYGTPVRYKAHISNTRTLVRTLTGQQVESGQAIYLSTTAAIQPSAQVTLSTADVGSTQEAAIHPTIISVERLSDKSGPHHVVLRT